MNTAITNSGRASGLVAPTSAIDPVCGMSVQADKAAARLEFDGKLYLFCSADCQHKFETNPKKYIGTCAARVRQASRPRPLRVSIQSPAMGCRAASMVSPCCWVTAG
jgi:P-type Cu+ transporter